MKLGSIRIGLVQINNSFNNSCYFPYTLGLLQAYSEAAYAGPFTLDFLDYIYRRHPVKTAVQQLFTADIVAFSVYVWNVRLSLEIARQLKEKNPDMVIVFGGPQVPRRADDFLMLYPWIDLACTGEGEKTFKDILDAYPEHDWESVPSVHFVKDGQVISTQLRERQSDLSVLPSPYLSGIFDRLIEKENGMQWLGLIESNRGCPFSCSYCDWGSATQSRMHWFDMERVRAEIEWFARNKIEFVFCCDSNFGIHRRDLDIARFVARTKNTYGYPVAFSVQNSKNTTERSYEIQMALASAGLNKGVTLAMQTLDETALNHVGRKNISIQFFEELQRRFNRNQVETYTDLILALPGETYDSFVRGTARVIASGQHNRVQFINLSILPNAPMGDQAYQEKHGIRIVSSPVVNHHGSLEGMEEGLREYQDLVVGTLSMPFSDWIRARCFSWMCSLLYFDKLIQIPLLLLSYFSDSDLVDLFQGFCTADPGRFPVIAGINFFFEKEAMGIPEGKPEYALSKQWLNVYWPHDEYVFIDLCLDTRRLDAFYEESETIMREVLDRQHIAVPGFLADAVKMNRAMIHRPYDSVCDDTIRLEWPILEAFETALRMEKADVHPCESFYIIKFREPRSIDDWLREVVWFGNKKGAYWLPVTRLINEECEE